jgi:hypothetical protein
MPGAPHLETQDLWVAARALASNLTLVTNNEKGIPARAWSENAKLGRLGRSFSLSRFFSASSFNSGMELAGIRRHQSSSPFESGGPSDPRLINGRHGISLPPPPVSVD